MIKGLNVRIIDGPVDEDVTAHVDGLEFGKAALGGFGESAQFMLDLPRHRFPTLGEQSRVIVTDDDGTVVWEGFASDPGPVEGEDGEAFEVLAMGAMVLASDRVEALAYVDSEPGSWVLADGSVETGQHGSIDHGFRLAHPQGQAIDQGYFVGAEWRLLEHASQDVAQVRFTAKAGLSTADYTLAVYAVGSGGEAVLVDGLGGSASTSTIAHTVTLPAGTRVVQLRWVRAGLATNVTDGLAWVDITYPVVIGSRVDAAGAAVAPGASLSSGDVVADLIGRGMLTQVDPRAAVIEGGVVHSQLTYPTGVRGSTVLADLRKSDKEFIWGYGPRGPQGYAFYWRKWPTVPRYTLTDADEIARTGGDDERCHRVSVYFTDPETKRTKHITVVSNLAASVRVRDADPVTLDEATEEEAFEAGREVLLELSAKPPSGTATVTRRIFDHLLQVEVEPWEIEPGAVATIESTGEVLRITSTSVDADETGVSCTLSIGDPEQTLEDRLLSIARGEVDPGKPLIDVSPDKPSDNAPPTTAPTSDLAEYTEGEVNDLWDEMATKSQHLLSTSAPTPTDPNNPGDVWEQYQEVSVEADGATPVSPPQKRIIGRWRGQGGVGNPAGPPFAWVPMNLDATFIPLLDIGSGTFGDLHGERLIANTIGVGKLVVSDFRNLVTDPRFELGDWTNPSQGAAATFYTPDPSFTPPPTMTNPVRVARWYTTGGDNRIMQGTTLAVTPGDRLDIRMWVWTQGTTGTVSLQCIFRDRSAAVVEYAAATTAAAAASGWREVSSEAVVPAGASDVRIHLLNQGVNANVIVANPRVRRKNGGELIVDGAISALLIRGDDFQTHDDGPAPWATGRGVKWNKDGIYGYPAAGSATPTFFLDANTGLASLTGGMTTGSGQNDVTIVRGTSAANPSGIEWTPSGLGVNTSTRADRPSITSWSTGDPPRWGYDPNPAGASAVELSIRGGKFTGFSEQPRIDLDTIRYDGLTPPSSRYLVTEANVVANRLNFRDHGTEGRLSDVEIAYGGVTLYRTPARFTTGGFFGGGVTGASIDNDGALVRTSSSEAVKDNIAPLPLSEARKALDLEAVTFTWTDAKRMGARTHPGFIAEQAHEAGAGLWVTYEGDDENGAPSGFRYAELTAAHNVLIADLVARVEQLEARIAHLEANQ